MRRISFHIMMAMIIVTIIILHVAGSIIDSKRAPIAENGVIDLRNWNFEKDGIVPLNGTWKMIWGSLLPPERSTEPNAMMTDIRVPSSWNQLTNPGIPNIGTGAGTYYLTIKKEAKDTLLGVWLPSIYSSYRMWVNGKPIIHEGQVSEYVEYAVPSVKQRMVMINIPGSTADIAIEVTNFSHHRGGIWQPIYLGSSEKIISKSRLELVRDSMLFGCLLMVGLYHIGLFIERRKDWYTFLFAVLCIAMAGRILTSGDAILLTWFPSLSWYFVIRLEYVLMIVATMAGCGYMRYLFYKDACYKTYVVMNIAGVILIGTILFLPVLSFTSNLSIYQFYVIGAACYVFIMNIKAVHNQRLGAHIALIGFTVLNILVVNDILYYHSLAPIRDLAPIGLVFCIFMQSLMISLRYSKAMYDVESVTIELRELNANLEERIQERTAALTQMNANLELKNFELERMETSRRHLFTNISHDLRTPMTLIRGYLEALQDEVIQDREQQKKYIRLMLNKINGLNHLIDDLFELSKLEARRVPVAIESVLLEHFISHLEEHYELELRSRGLLFACYNLTYRNAPPVSIMLEVDIDRMMQVFDNIIYNAVKFTPIGGSITIEVDYVKQDQAVHIKITDTGIGVGEEDLPYLFDRFYKNDKSRNSMTGGSGIGLAIAKEIVELHLGRIGVESVQGHGTTFYIILPAQVK
ncbi:ATP-binding protein [Paenibacillus alvei]|uniref:sensor histidine kinase n=1 Tax=Paenibacillus alvei TaxID=44250 RepID=UPI003D27D2D3